MKLVLAGGTGALGRRLADDLVDRGDEVVILTRRVRPEIPHRQVVWDGRTVDAWADELDDAVLLNLAGELVDRPPTAANIELLTRSRVEPTTALAAAARAGAMPARWLQMSTLAIYGDAGEDVVDESHPVTSGPPQMTGVASAWEAAAVAGGIEDMAILRTGIVLNRDTPAFDRLTKLTRRGLGGRISAGDQWVSWIHIDDFVRAVELLVDGPATAGVVHVTSPNPIRNRDMMAALRHALHRPWSPPTPKPFVHLGARLLRSDAALALTGRRCVPTRLLEAGFEFDHPHFAGALADLVGQEAA